MENQPPNQETVNDSWVAIANLQNRFRARRLRTFNRRFETRWTIFLDFCEERSEEPEKPFSGRLMVRLSADLHRKLYVEAKRGGKSLNKLISERLAR